jgi:hypothetical protein|tara:strand:+ start:340 stop:495 length:156 start_codon:yes stop_codon:yes gene_type:complete
MDKELKHTIKQANTTISMTFSSIYPSIWPHYEIQYVKKVTRLCAAERLGES